MAFLEKQLEIKESSIPGAGLGLFTKEFIKKGSRIVEYKGRIRTWKEVEDHYDNFYIFFVTEDHVIDSKRYKSSFARYINDAQGFRKIKGLINNAEFVKDGLRVYVDAKKDIAAGSEIFVGYGKEYWQVLRKNQKIDTT